jgi:hypothetical protein
MLRRCTKLLMSKETKGFAYIKSMYDIKELEKLEYVYFREGLEIHIIFDWEDGSPTRCGILKSTPGALVPHHWHPGCEVLIPLVGFQQDSRVGRYGPGSMLINQPLSEHSAMSEGGYLLGIWQKKIVFEHLKEESDKTE